VTNAHASSVIQATDGPRCSAELLAGGLPVNSEDFLGEGVMNAPFLA